MSSLFLHSRPIRLVPDTLQHESCRLRISFNDPFIVLMDDRLDIGDRTVGEPHPRAGFETVTLILDGAIYDRDEAA